MFLGHGCQPWRSCSLCKKQDRNLVLCSLFDNASVLSIQCIVASAAGSCLIPGLPSLCCNDRLLARRASNDLFVRVVLLHVHVRMQVYCLVFPM